MRLHLFVIVICYAIFSCQRHEATVNITYDSKANELIKQVLTEDKCTCLLTLPKETLIQISKAENPGFDVEKYVKQKLFLGSNFNLQTLEQDSKKFQLDANLIKEIGVKLIDRRELRFASSNIDSAKSLLKKCPLGITYITKPIFDREYKFAIMDYGQAMTCVKILGFPFYRYQNGKWEQQNSR